MTIRETLEKRRKGILDRPGVAGLGIGQRDGQPAVVIMLESDSLTLRESLPKTMGGVPVVVEEVGIIKAW